MNTTEYFHIVKLRNSLAVNQKVRGDIHESSLRKLSLKKKKVFDRKSFDSEILSMTIRRNVLSKRLFSMTHFSALAPAPMIYGYPTNCIDGLTQWFSAPRDSNEAKEYSP